MTHLAQCRMYVNAKPTPATEMQLDRSRQQVIGDYRWQLFAKCPMQSAGKGVANKPCLSKKGNVRHGNIALLPRPRWLSRLSNLGIELLPMICGNITKHLLAVLSRCWVPRTAHDTSASTMRIAFNLGVEHSIMICGAPPLVLLDCRSIAHHCSDVRSSLYRISILAPLAIRCACSACLSESPSAGLSLQHFQHINHCDFRAFRLAFALALLERNC